MENKDENTKPGGTKVRYYHYLMLLIAGLMLTSGCTEPRVCGQCEASNGTSEPQCFDSRSEVAASCPGGFTQGDAEVDGMVPTDEGTPDVASDGSHTDATMLQDAGDGMVSPDAHHGDALPMDAHTMVDATNDARSPPPDMGMGGSDGHIPPADAGPDMLIGDALPPPDASLDMGMGCDPRCGAQCHPNVEICDTVDNNCDGQVDENLNCACQDGQTQACYTGDPRKLGVGACSAGIQACDNGSWGQCNGEILPSPETCDNQDDDCNGIVDDVEHTGETCAVNGQFGACASGHLACDGHPNGEFLCISDRVTPVAEVCGDLTDNDCDGRIDEGDCNMLPPDATPPPVDAASADGALPPTDDALLPPSDATSPPPDAADAAVLPPDATPCMPSPEVCDGLDNDCDGQVDNVGANPLRVPCYDGPEGTQDVGQCRPGTAECIAGVISSQCEGETLPSIEVCDGLDNNCENNIDEGDPGSGQPCNSGQPGICAQGQTLCANGNIACVPDSQPQGEDCGNGSDDNCDGTVDNGPGCTCHPGDSRGCYDGPGNTAGVGLCHVGSSACLANGMAYGACQNETLPAAEICDGLDNDCDTLVDNGLVDQGCYDGPDETRGVGACRDGLQHCNGHQGWGICDHEIMPAPEICDGVDNDCDGITDEAPSDVGGACTAGQGECAVAGVTICRGGQQVCNAIPRAPQAEKCDGLDNDCDGQIDNDISCPIWTMAFAGPSGQIQGMVTEVTKAQYASCVAAGTCPAPQPSNQAFPCNWQQADRADHPINCVTWDEATTYCHWIGGDLPTEGEWEALAGGRARVEPWGNSPDPDCTRAHTSECPPRSTLSVITAFLAGVSPAGAFDMIGSLREWTKTLSGGLPLLKGGGFDDLLKIGADLVLTIAWNQPLPSDRRSYDLGFRCVRIPPPN